MNANQALASLPHQLTLLRSARDALAQASSFEEIKRIRDVAEAVRHLARAAHLGLEIQNGAAELKLNAERKAGAMLAKMDKNSGRILRGCSLQPRDSAATLAELGIEKTQCHRWQLEALVPARTALNPQKFVTSSSRSVLVQDSNSLLAA